MNLYIRFGSLPTEAAKTSECLEMMDKLFDILNSSRTSCSKKFHTAFKGLPYQLNFLKECLEFFESLQISDGNSVVIINKIKCIKYLNISINSLIQIIFTG